MSQTLFITPVEDPEDLEQARALMQEYWHSFGFTPCFQNFAAELEGLPGDYAPPAGRLAIAYIGAQAAGCVALRPAGGNRAEIKRLYIRPAYRGQRLGRALVDWVIVEARAAGYAELIGDTMPVMNEALALYRSMGFEVGEPEEASGKIDLRLKLENR
jgi:GNAT superfamily N-acetyltransferase